MQMHSVMNYTSEYYTLCRTTLPLLQANPIFHVETSIYATPMVGALFSDKQPNMVSFDFMPFPRFSAWSISMRDIILEYVQKVA